MPIDVNLLTKAAKVYEASEPVEGEKPKEVFESHKKCAPGEFGMNKEGGNKQADLTGAYLGGTNGATIGGLLGGGLGGVGGLAAGAFSSRKGHRVGDTLRGGLKGLVGGGLLGAGTGAGLGASALGQLPVRAFIDAAKSGNPLTAEEMRAQIGDGINPAAFAGLTTLGTLGGAAAGGGLAGYLTQDKKEDKKDKNDDNEKESAHAIEAGLPGKSWADEDKPTKKKQQQKESAYAFGVRFKQAFNLTPEMGYGAAGGGLLGAGLGGLAGFMNPGEEEDEDGRVRQRSRFGAALRGALGGGAAGALGGGALGHFAPGHVNKFREMLFGAPKQQAPTTTRKMMPLPGGRQVFAMPGVKTPEALAAEREQYLAEQAKKNQPVPPSEEIQLVPPTGL